MSYQFSQLSRLLDELRERLNIAVIFGGERGRPGSVLYPTNIPRSGGPQEEAAANIAESLRRSGFRHVSILPEDLSLGHQLREHQIHFAWISSGGVQGANPTCHLPSLLEMLGVPYVGHGPLNTTVLDHKHTFKRELGSAGLPTAPYLTWDSTRGPFMPDINSRFWLAFGADSGAFVVKPVSGSAGPLRRLVEQHEDLPAAVAEVYDKTMGLVLIERFLPGREFVVSVCGPTVARGDQIARNQGPFAFSALECIHGDGEALFVPGQARGLDENPLHPLHADDELAEGLKSLAQRIYLDFNLDSLVRIDVRGDEEGRLHIMEANPQPDLGGPGSESENRVYGGLGEHDMTYDDLVLSLLANRLDFLLTFRPNALAHVETLCTG